MKATKLNYEIDLNEIEVPENDKKSNGGLIPDYCKYGSWLRKNDTIAFECGFSDWKRDQFKNPYNL